MQQLTRTILIFVSTLSATPFVYADTMECGNKIISGDQIVGQTMAQILQMCGPPDSGMEGTWVYKRDQSVYQLHFDGNGHLDSVTEEE